LKTPKWICNICKQTLTRKWNAKRHCSTKHDGLFDSIISFREYLLTTTTDSNPNESFYLQNVNELPYPKRLFFRDKSTNFNLYPHLSSTPDPIDDFTKREMMLTDILNKIAPKYEEIGNLLSHVPEPKKTQILGSIISRALYDDNPIRFINKELKDWRKAKFYNKMLYDASVFLGFNKKSTKEYLKMGLKEDTID
jgi:hypothetical protein